MDPGPSSRYEVPVPVSNWVGVNSMFLYALEDNDRRAHLDALQKEGIRVVRVFLRRIPEGFKGSTARETPDLEDLVVGLYDDTILERVDVLMFECVQRNIKLIIGLHDRWSLGCWARDAYVSEFWLPDVSPACDWRRNQPTGFYNSDGQVFVNRLRHILSHPNPYFDNRPWSDLSEAVLAFAPQNEQQGYMLEMSGHNETWACDMARVIRQEIDSHSSKPNGILVSSGGSGTQEESMAQYLYDCPEIDMIALHAYSTESKTVRDGIIEAVWRSFMVEHKPRVVLEEFGIGDRSDIPYFEDVLEQARLWGIPAMPWQFLRPSNPNDFEFFTDDILWNATVSANRAAMENGGSAKFGWPQLLPTIQNPIDQDVNPREDVPPRDDDSLNNNDDFTLADWVSQPSSSPTFNPTLTYGDSSLEGDQDNGDNNDDDFSFGDWVSQPTSVPSSSISPTIESSEIPSNFPTVAPVTAAPITLSPTTASPSARPSIITQAPTTNSPSASPSIITQAPTTNSPSASPSISPVTIAPITPVPTTLSPSASPSVSPVTSAPVTTAPITQAPTTTNPSASPSISPVSSAPVTAAPITTSPSGSPTSAPFTGAPVTISPLSPAPQTLEPSTSPSLDYSTTPSLEPSSEPSSAPVRPVPVTRAPVLPASTTGSPSSELSAAPVTTSPVTRAPLTPPPTTAAESTYPSLEKSENPTVEPSNEPSMYRSQVPSGTPSLVPTASADLAGTGEPTMQLQDPTEGRFITTSPTIRPTQRPTRTPTSLEPPFAPVSHSPTSLPTQRPVTESLITPNPAAPITTGPTNVPTTSSNIIRPRYPSWGHQGRGQFPTVSNIPSGVPNSIPTDIPSLSSIPSDGPSLIPSSLPSLTNQNTAFGTSDSSVDQTSPLWFLIPLCILAAIAIFIPVLLLCLKCSRRSRYYSTDEDSDFDSNESYSDDSDESYSNDSRDVLVGYGDGTGPVTSIGMDGKLQGIRAHKFNKGKK